MYEMRIPLPQTSRLPLREGGGLISFTYNAILFTKELITHAASHTLVTHLQHTPSTLDVWKGDVQRGIVAIYTPITCLLGSLVKIDWLKYPFLYVQM